MELIKENFERSIGSSQSPLRLTSEHFDQDQYPADQGNDPYDELFEFLDYLDELIDFFAFQFSHLLSLIILYH